MSKSYGQYCPIAKAVEVLGERWSVLVVCELLIGSTQFNEIARGLPTMSRTLLAKRLRQLEAAGLVERLDGSYHLTPAGEDLCPLVFGFGVWAEQWILEDPTVEELDPQLLLWWVHGPLDTDSLPDRRVVLEFEFTEVRFHGRSPPVLDRDRARGLFCVPDGPGIRRGCLDHVGRPNAPHGSHGSGADPCGDPRRPCRADRDPCPGQAATTGSDAHDPRGARGDGWAQAGLMKARFP